jgi:thiol:disulfide interchange protein DsbD
MAILFTVIGLNLAGVFQFSGVLPGNLASVRARHPIADHALTGALAVAVASPCTAPFMGAALSAAVSLPMPWALSVFAALGLGMALPCLLLSVFPAWVRWLPGPGPWMLRFKVLMAFPMFGTAVWLVWVLGRQVGIDAASSLLALLVAVAFLAWTVGASGFGKRARATFGTLAAVALVATASWAWTVASISPPSAPAAEAGQRWNAWSRDAVDRAVSEGRPVFVDFTAAWCVTCQFNKRTLSDEAVLADFEARDVLLLRADWTRRDDAITRELARLGRSGVPVYALYPPHADSPRLLPEVLTVSALRAALAGLPPASNSSSTVSDASSTN